MMILLTGGSGQGKSTLAIELLSQMSGPKYLVDTALVYDEAEAAMRQKKQAALQAQDIEFLSQGRDLNTLQLSKEGHVVLECMCHLTANEMFQEHTFFNPSIDFDRVRDYILRGISHLKNQCKTMIIVTNEVSCDGIQYDECTMAYRRMLGYLNRILASQADCVCELVCGIPVVLKGKLPVETEKEPNMKDLTLIIGPENAGKLDYVTSLGYTYSQMSTDPRADFPVLPDLQKVVMEYPGDPMELLPLLLKKKVVICDEVGSGIIPVSKDLTDARVNTGKLCNHLAKQARHVIRVICGIPIILK